METTQIQGTEIKEILQTVFLPGWNTYAHICKDGTIKVQLIMGQLHSREEFLESFSEGHNDEFIDSRIKLFDDLEKYYNKTTPSTETNAFDVTITYKWGDKVTYEGSVWTFEPKIGTQQHTTGYNPSFMNYWIKG